MSRFQKNVKILINLCQYFEKKSGIRYRVSGIGYQVSGIRYRVSGTGYQVPGIRYRVSGTGYPQDARAPATGRAIHLRPGPPRILVIYIYIYTRIFGPRFARPQFEYIKKYKNI